MVTEFVVAAYKAGYPSDGRYAGLFKMEGIGGAGQFLHSSSFMLLRSSRNYGTKPLSRGGAVSVQSATTRGPKKCCLQYCSTGSAFGFFGKGMPSPLRLKTQSSNLNGQNLIKLTQTLELGLLEGILRHACLKYSIVKLDI